jgi:hypothetical protein
LSRRQFLALTIPALAVGQGPQNRGLKMVCVGGHPDDPESGCGGTLFRYAISLWRVQTSPNASLRLLKRSLYIGGNQNPGFFTTISSNGTTNPIIWALSHPNNSGKNPLFLYAFNPEAGKSTMKKLFFKKAGYWPNLGGNSNLVPVVANGQVFVASNKILEIFGLTGAKTRTKKK